ncbi:MAG TPA: glycosyltransferase family 4 protein, partial [Anaerolineales bacterium]
PMADDPPWRSVQFISELIRHQNIDLVHSHLPKAHVLAGPAGCLTERPVVMTIHGMDISSWELGIFRTTHAHMNVVCQLAYAQALSLGVPDDRVNVIPNGVDLKTFRPDPRGTHLRSLLNLPMDAPLVGFVGRLEPEKGTDMFVRVAEFVHRSHPEAYFVMVGDGSMYGELEQAARRAGLQDCLCLPRSLDHMHLVYPAFDVLVQTSRVEGMPFSLLEGMACGLPVATMNAGGVNEIVEMGTTGFIYPVGDWAGLASAVTRLIEDPALRDKMGAAARQRVEKHFDVNHMISRLAQQFRSLLPPSAQKEQGQDGLQTRAHSTQQIKSTR